MQGLGGLVESALLEHGGQGFDEFVVKHGCIINIAYGSFIQLILLQLDPRLSSPC
jgi:hypothetical protein